MIMYISISLKIVSEYIRNVAMQTFIHENPNYIIIDIANIQNFVRKI